MTDNDDEFEKLRLEISAAAMKMDTWGGSVPLKWILLEYLIEINRNNGKNFVTFSEVVKLAKHRDIGIEDNYEVALFLRFQHESGNIIFFENILDLIILNPKWLIDAFRCLVPDKIDDNLHHRTDWTAFVRNGLISKSLITKLFESKRGGQFLEQREHLLHVMETFDILVKIDNTDSYIMPSMMPSVSFDEICQQTGVDEPNCNRTSWLCLQFEFIPPAFFNHVFGYFLRKYKPSKTRNTLQSLALFRWICIFDIDSYPCTKLMVAMSSNTIALQLLSFSKEREDFGLICSNIRQGLMKETEAIKKRYKLNIFYELRFKCSAGHYHNDTISYKELTRLAEYCCKQHNEVHQSITTYLPWMTHTNEVKSDNYLF